MTPKVFLVLSAAVAVMLTLQTTQGFTPNHRHHSRFGAVVSLSNAPEIPVPFPVKSTSLSMATEDKEESEDSKERRRKQQLGAGALLLFGVLYDFFITHHGVPFWE
jgi:hypothetical protein